MLRKHAGAGAAVGGRRGSGARSRCGREWAVGEAVDDVGGGAESRRRYAIEAYEYLGLANVHGVKAAAQRAQQQRAQQQQQAYK